MKKKVALVLVLSLMVTMLLPMTAMAAEVYIAESSGELRDALAKVQPGDTIRLQNLFVEVGQAFPSPFIPAGVTLIITSSATFGTNGGNTSGTRITLYNEGTMIVEAGGTFELKRMSTLNNNGVIHFMTGSKYDSGTFTSSSVIVNNTGAIYIDEGVTLSGNFVNSLKAAKSTEEPDLCDVCKYLITHCVCPPIDPDPVPLTSIGGDAGITITRPDPMLPFLVNPESAQAKDLFDEANILGGTGFNFGEHKYTSAPQEINSLNSLSMIYGYLDPFNEIFTVTCEISDFLMEDDTPLFTDFSLYMGRQNNYFDRDFETEYYASSKAKVYESKASFDLAKNDPVVVVKTDAVGHVLTNYIGVLKLQQDTTKTVGQANATITWEIGIEVI